MDSEHSIIDFSHDSFTVEYKFIPYKTKDVKLVKKADDLYYAGLLTQQS
jgi:hypothetical protein